MTCQHCVRAVTKAIQAAAPAAAVDVDLSTKTVTVQTDATEADLQHALAAAGYPAVSATGAPTAEAGTCCGSCHA